jgi:hypothetical protein
MYQLTSLAKSAQHDQLRAAERRQQPGTAYAARRTADRRGGPARRLAGLVAWRGRRPAQAH